MKITLLGESGEYTETITVADNWKPALPEQARWLKIPTEDGGMYVLPAARILSLVLAGDRAG